MDKMKYNPLTGNLDMVSSSEAQQHPWIFGMVLRTDKETIESCDHLDLLYNNNEITITIAGVLEDSIGNASVSFDLYANDVKILSRDSWMFTVEYTLPVTRDVITFRLVGRVNGVETVKELTVKRSLPMFLEYMRASSTGHKDMAGLYRMIFAGGMVLSPFPEYRPQIDLTQVYGNHGGKIHLCVPENITFRMMTSNGIIIPMTHTVDDTLVIGGEVCRYNVYSTDTIYSQGNENIIPNVRIIYEQN